MEAAEQAVRSHITCCREGNYVPYSPLSTGVCASRCLWQDIFFRIHVKASVNGVKAQGFASRALPRWRCLR